MDRDWIFEIVSDISTTIEIVRDYSLDKAWKRVVEDLPLNTRSITFIGIEYL